MVRFTATATVFYPPPRSLLLFSRSADLPDLPCVPRAVFVAYFLRGIGGKGTAGVTAR